MSVKPRRVAGILIAAAGCALLAMLAIAAIAAAHMGSIAMGVDPHPAADDAASDAARSGPEPEAAGSGPVDWDYWLGVNPDIVGWIQVPGTTIDQPIVQARAEDPQYWLSHDVYGNWNYHGCPYVDAGCTDGLDSANAIVFGHNLIDRTMFSELDQYHDRSFALEHAQIVIHTPVGTRHLAVAGAAVVPGSQALKRTSFASADDFATYAAARLDECDMRLTDALPHDHMLTLCTCSYYQTPQDERTLVYAF